MNEDKAIGRCINCDTLVYKDRLGTLRHCEDSNINCYPESKATLTTTLEPSEIGIDELIDFISQNDSIGIKLRISVKINGANYILPVNKLKVLALKCHSPEDADGLAIVLSYTNKEFRS